MPFNSFNFWLIFPFIFGVYWLIPAKYNGWRKADANLSQDKSFFQDRTHMNHVGASLFTTKLIRDIQRLSK